VEVESVVSGLTGPGVRTAARDSGLVRVIGPLGLTAAIVNSVVGSAIFVVPAAMAVGAGSLAPLAFLACAVAMAPVVICFAAGGRRVPTSGGPCGYVEAAFGPMAGFIAGTLLSVGCVLSCGGIVGALADGATGVLPPAFATAARALVILGTLGLMTVVNVNGAASGTRLVEVGTVPQAHTAVRFHFCWRFGFAWDGSVTAGDTARRRLWTSDDSRAIRVRRYGGTSQRKWRDRKACAHDTASALCSDDLRHRPLHFDSGNRAGSTRSRARDFARTVGGGDAEDSSCPARPIARRGVCVNACVARQ